MYLGSNITGIVFFKCNSFSQVYLLNLVSGTSHSFPQNVRSLAECKSLFSKKGVFVVKSLMK